jgi:hypothetical protein|tara:strand:+ start:185 stop:727 length:543 start_codon:yes stop_codon:yes gene_type:complete
MLYLGRKRATGLTLLVVTLGVYEQVNTTCESRSDMPRNYLSNCLCGNVKISLSLPNSIEGYELRACDCEFCQSNRITYISDRGGSLLVASRAPLIQIKQGSEQATFWQCPSCKDVVAVTAMLNNGLKGAVNAQLFSRHLDLGVPVVVSPKFLSPKEKRIRWDSSWLRASFNVRSYTNDTV